MLILRATMHSGTVVEQKQDGIYDDDMLKNAAMRKFFLYLLENEGSLDDDFIEVLEWFAY